MIADFSSQMTLQLTLVDVRGVGLLARLSPLLLVAVSARRGRLRGLLRRLRLSCRLSGSLRGSGGRSLAGGGSGLYPGQPTHTIS